MNPFALLAFEDAKVYPSRAAKAMQVPLKKSPPCGSYFLRQPWQPAPGTFYSAFIKGQRAKAQFGPAEKSIH
jgi:hypothetical protein